MMQFLKLALFLKNIVLFIHTYRHARVIYNRIYDHAKEAYLYIKILLLVLIDIEYFEEEIKKFCIALSKRCKILLYQSNNISF